MDTRINSLVCVKADLASFVLCRNMMSNLTNLACWWWVAALTTSAAAWSLTGVLFHASALCESLAKKRWVKDTFNVPSVNVLISEGLVSILSCCHGGYILILLRFKIFLERMRKGLLSVSSVQFKMMSRCSERPICAPPWLWEVSSVLPLKQFQCLSDWWWPFFVYLYWITKWSIYAFSMFSGHLIPLLQFPFLTPSLPQ